MHYYIIILLHYYIIILYYITENASARPPHPQEEVTAGGVAESLCWIWCGSFGKGFAEDFYRKIDHGINFPSENQCENHPKIFAKSHRKNIENSSNIGPGGSKRAPEWLWEALRHASGTKLHVGVPKVPNYFCFLASFWDPKN